jgi:hypothetical protein
MIPQDKILLEGDAHNFRLYWMPNFLHRYNQYIIIPGKLLLAENRQSWNGYGIKR